MLFDKKQIENFRENLRSAWKASGLKTQGEFAEKIGIGNGFLGEILSGQKTGERQIPNISKALGKTISEMIGEMSTPDARHDQAIKDLAEIFTDGDEAMKQAISSNLREFVGKIKSDKRVKDLEGKMKILERRLDHLERTNNPHVPDAASGGAGTTT